MLVWTGWKLVSNASQLRRFTVAGPRKLCTEACDPASFCDHCALVSGGDLLCLRTCREVNGCFISARINCFEHRRSVIKADERFEIISLPNNYFALKTRDGTYWSAKSDGSLRADARIIGNAEKFRFYLDRAEQRLAIKSWYGWLSAQPDGSLETYVGNGFYECMTFTGWKDETPLSPCYLHYA